MKENSIEGSPNEKTLEMEEAKKVGWGLQWIAEIWGKKRKKRFKRYRWNELKLNW